MSLLVPCFKDHKDLHMSYKDPSVVLGLFRHISFKAQHFVMIFQFLDKMSEREILNFAQTPSEAEEILQELKSLGFFSSNNNNIIINPDVQSQLKLMLSGPVSCNLRIKRKPDRRKPTVETIVQTTQNNWKGLINYLIGLRESVPISILRLLLCAGLVTQSNQDFPKTSECFRFLLKTQPSQIQYLLKNIMNSSSDKANTAKFFYNLSIAELGKDYSTKDTNKGIVEDLTEIGLLYKYNSKSKRYYVAPGMIGLLTDSPKIVPATEKFLVVETNFRVYAYTQSELHIVLLSYFLKLEYRLPGMVIGFVTRESVCDALKEGIFASQIADFLRNHSESVPDNVMDQLFLWEKERTRISDFESYMLDEFADLSLYRSTLNFAQGCGAYLWDNIDRRVIILHKQKAEPVLKYLQSLDRIIS
jgi:transcription initiation factor TFIIH subunit 4